MAETMNESLRDGGSNHEPIRNPLRQGPGHKGPDKTKILVLIGLASLVIAWLSFRRQKTQTAGPVANPDSYPGSSTTGTYAYPGSYTPGGGYTAGDTSGASSDLSGLIGQLQASQAAEAGGFSELSGQLQGIQAQLGLVPGLTPASSAPAGAGLGAPSVDHSYNTTTNNYYGPTSAPHHPATHPPTHHAPPTKTPPPKHKPAKPPPSRPKAPKRAQAA